jgi:hypothetical protein
MCAAIVFDVDRYCLRSIIADSVREEGNSAACIMGYVFLYRKYLQLYNIVIMTGTNESQR